MSGPSPAEPTAATPAEAPKPRRSRGSTRQRAAGAASRAETQRLLVVAAGELFAERGYAGSTVTAIADRAGVSLQTLYLAWGSKRQLLRAFMEQGLSGSPTAVTDATWAELAGARLLANLPDDPDPHTYIRGMARFFRATAERAALGWQLYRDAAAVDPERAGRSAGILQAAAVHRGRVAQRPADRRTPGGDDPRRRVDTLMVIMGPKSYDLLVRQSGYSLDRFEQWLIGTLIVALLEPDQR